MTVAIGIPGLRLAAVELSGVDDGGERLLDAAELLRADTFGTPALRRRFVAGRIAQRRFAAGLLGVDPAELRAVYGCPDCGAGGTVDHGRPGYWRGGAPTGLRLSLSRSGGWALLAGTLARGVDVGVDLQEVAAAGFDGFDDVALTPGERAAVLRLPASERPAARASAWAVKEAVAKALGRGLRMDPAGIDTLGLFRARGAGPVDGGTPGIRLYALDTAALGLPAGFAAALALATGEGSGS
ncbi:4'-phosphopantetheinyl transferase family protein [Pseudarthrobacter sp. P1]|uniref:4'-phosphopantetheinyl transferase family protein n=1 Tax=Pseudarthrobacter sp. P1 TaxID=3418418 RepID=UPI003CEE2DF7